MFFGLTRTKTKLGSTILIADALSIRPQIGSKTLNIAVVILVKLAGRNLISIGNYFHDFSILKRRVSFGKDLT